MLFIYIKPCIYLYIRVYKWLITFSKHGDSTMESHYLYLTNTAGRNVFTGNTSSAFENLIHPLSLDRSVEYEVGLANFLYPSLYYTLEAGNADYAMTVVSECHDRGQTHNLENMTYIPGFSVLGKPTNMDTLVKKINRDFYNKFRSTYGEEIADKYLSEKEILSYDETHDRCRVQHTYAPKSDIYMCDLSITFSRRLARILGFVEGRRYAFFISTPDEGRDARRDTRRDNLARASPRYDGGVDFIYIYSDIVAPSRFGHDLVNILDAFAIRGSTAHKSSQPILYKPLLHREITSVAIKILDQDGFEVAFENDHALTIILHIRAK